MEMRLNLLLWIVQGLLAALFVFAGGMKLVVPIEAMTGAVPLPGPFLRFIGVAESLGGLGLVLPGLLRIREDLTPLAAAGLVIIMVGATFVTLLSGGTWSALFPLAVGLLCGWVAYARTAARPGARVATSSAIRAASRPTPWIISDEKA
jgi:uncharacterized membrane protein YphA (DoxX/SURF4 family)